MESILVILPEIIEAIQFIYEVRKVIDGFGNVVSQIVAVFDDDGDGVTDREEVLISFDVSIPDLSENYNLVDKDGKLGVGSPQYEIIPASDFSAFLDTIITGSNNGIIIDDDVYCPLPVDYDGDGLSDWGRVIDENDNGVPDASPDAPFYPVGSEGYSQIISSEDSGKSLIIVSPDGNISVYDPSGELQYEDFNKAYSLWLQDNAALDKPFKFYSVTEALLLIVALFAGVSLVGKLFKRRNYNGRY